GAHRAIDRDAVVIEPLAEVDERPDRLVDHRVVELAPGERAVAEPDRHALGLDPDQLAGAQLGDDHPDRVRSGIDRAQRGPLGRHREQASTPDACSRCGSPRERRAIPGERSRSACRSYFLAAGLAALPDPALEPDPEPAAGVAGPALSGIFTLS